MSDGNNNPNERGRYWAGLIYPGDSCPDNWQELMQLPAYRFWCLHSTIRTLRMPRLVS